MNQIYHDIPPIGHEHHEQDENSPLQGLTFSTIPGSLMRRAIGMRPVTGKQLGKRGGMSRAGMGISVFFTWERGYNSNRFGDLEMAHMEPAEQMLDEHP